MCSICSGTSGLLTYIQWFSTTQAHVLGNLPQGFQVDQLGKSSPSRGPRSLACQTPLGCSGESPWSITEAFSQVKICHQSFGQGLGWWVIVQELWDQGELPHVHHHWSHTQLEICHRLAGAHLRLKMPLVFFLIIAPAYLWCMSTHKYVWEKDMYMNISFLPMTKTKLSFFHTLQSKANLCSPGGTLNMCPGRFMAV